MEIYACVGFMHGGMYGDTCIVAVELLLGSAGTFFAVNQNFIGRKRCCGRIVFFLGLSRGIKLQKRDMIITDKSRIGGGSVALNEEFVLVRR